MLTRATLAAIAALAVPGGASVAEDSPAWNWATMGNHKRAIVTMNGTPLVVGPCRFKRLMQSGMVSYRTSDVQLGDFTAVHAAC